MPGPDVEQLTLFQEDSRANLFPWQETRKGNRTSVIYGLRCYELSENLRRVGSSVRTYLESCRLPLPTLLRTWSVSAITSRCLILKLRLSVQDTDENECSLLLKTPTDFDATVKSWKKNPKFGDSGSLAQEIYSGFIDNRFWPTPTTQETEHPEAEMTATGRRKTKDGENSHSVGLADAVKLWPTPTVDDSANVNPKPNRIFGLVAAVNLFPTPRANKPTGFSSTDHRPTLEQTVMGFSNGEDCRGQTSGSLNPTWVEWLMGFPIGWTDLNA